jgi:hypothetical protein
MPASTMATSDVRVLVQNGVEEIDQTLIVPSTGAETRLALAFVKCQPPRDIRLRVLVQMGLNR